MQISRRRSMIGVQVANACEREHVDKAGARKDILHLI